MGLIHLRLFGKGLVDGTGAAMPLESGLFDSDGHDLKQRPLGQGRRLHTEAGRRLTGEATSIGGVKALNKTK